MRNILTCHTALPCSLTVGRAYRVTDVDKAGITIIDDNGREHHFTHEPDKHGRSWKTWLGEPALVHGDEDECGVLSK